jgi:hypothetical protein
LIQLYEYDDHSVDMSVDAIRALRETDRYGIETMPIYARNRDMCPRESTLRFAQDLVAEKLRQRFLATLREAFDKDNRQSKWNNQLQVLLAGGGSLDPLLYSRIEHDFIDWIDVVPKPGDLEDLPPSVDYRRFLVAYGLAHGSIRWPRDIFPSKVLPFIPKKRVLPTSW